MKHDTIADVVREMFEYLQINEDIITVREDDAICDWKHRLEQAIADQGTGPAAESGGCLLNCGSGAPPQICQPCFAFADSMEVKSRREATIHKARAERAEAERDAMRDRVDTLTRALTRIECETTEGNTTAIALKALYPAPDTAPAPPEHGDGLPKCPKCGKTPLHRASNCVQHRCNKGERVSEYTVDQWIRHCAENTPCRKCGDKPDHDNHTGEQMTCGCRNWLTPAEWLKRNEVNDDKDNRSSDEGNGRNRAGNSRNGGRSRQEHSGCCVSRPSGDFGEGKSTDESVAPSDALERAREKMQDRADWQAERRVKPHGMSTRMDDAEVASACTAYAVEAILDHLDAVKRGQG